LLHELLEETGSLYVHLDWHVGHYAKLVLDEIFGRDNFRNEIVWRRSAIATNVASQWRNNHDTILFYTKSISNTFHVQYGEYSESSKKHFTYQDERGVFQPVPLLGSGRTRAGETQRVWRGIDPNSIGKSGMHWLKKPTVLDELDSKGLIYWPQKNGLPRLKYYLADAKGRYLTDFWDDINVINSMAAESVGYQTQKPEALLDRIIKASSDEGDIILDCFCGSGTTAATAEKLSRRWIACDLSRFAIHTTRKRLLSIANVLPYEVQNLGKYERQMWAGAEFGKRNGEKAAERLCAYVEFILKLANATPITGYTWLHGIKGGRMIYVGAVDPMEY
jgi:adenine-specific DNA-methyltransferase